MEYGKEQILRLADSLEICADLERGCGECMFDKICDWGEENGDTILKEAAKVIREFVEERDAFLNFVAKIKFPKPHYGVTLEAIEARLGCCGNCNDQKAAVGDPSDAPQDAGKGQEWQMGLYERAIEKFGEEKQIQKAIEEMGELIVELSRALIADGVRDEHLLANIREELADVEIMCDQMEIIFGDVSDWAMYKLERLERKLVKGL